MPHVPQELVELGISLLKNNNESVYCPFNTGYFFANYLPKKSRKCGEAKASNDVFFAEVDAFLLDSDFHIRKTDCILLPSFIGDGGLEQFQSAIAFPPLNQKYGKLELNDIWGRFPESSLTGDVYHLRHMLAHVSNLVVCFVSNSFLFRSAAGEKLFKQDILEQGILNAVIALPSGLLSNTTIPVNILVLDKTKTTQEVTFIDASSEIFVEKVSRTRGRLVEIERIINSFTCESNSSISKKCSIDKIIANEYNLSPSRYVLSDEEQKLNNFLMENDTAQLEDVVEIIRPQAVKHDDNGIEEYTEYNVSNINGIGQLAGYGKRISVNQKEFVKAKKQIIKPNDILIVCKGAVGKVAVVGDNISKDSIASQAFSILRIKPHINSVTTESLYQYFISNFGQLQFKSIATGTSALMISAKDLSTLQVPVFDEKKLYELKMIRKKVMNTHNQITALNQEIMQLNNSWI
nr:type I restriction-modification system subunit M/S [Pseudoalteromonas distincta]